MLVILFMKSLGAELKLLQYENKISNINNKLINLNDAINNLLEKSCDENIIMLNMEKDVIRYNSTVTEFKHLSISKFVHLKTSFWKDKQLLVDDLNYIMTFLKQFNEQIPDKLYTMNEFSEINDKNISIQDGPLGCYCAHLKGMIYGYMNFKDYTIIVEDDVKIANTELIDTYLRQIPKDWDIICLNSIPKTSEINNNPFYKYEDEFHSTHFYIINHKCHHILFKYMYPITDQVDVLISNLIHKLNIYNIPKTVYQKLFSTNTQNNLHIILTSPNYSDVRTSLSVVENEILKITDDLFKDNKYNKQIATHILFDVVYSYIVNLEETKNNDDKVIFNYENNVKYEKLYNALYFIMECCIKGINITYLTNDIIDNIMSTINGFIDHNNTNKKYNENMKAYFYGSTSYVYLLEKNELIIKKYNEKFRWTCENHDDSLNVYNKELNILKNIGELIDYDIEKKILILKHKGESLYNKFNLPDDWKDQIVKIFKLFDEKCIYYPEFNLHNILVKNNNINFVDFGLAEFNSTKTNTINCDNFIKILQLMQNKFTDNMFLNHVLYKTLLFNLKKDKLYPNNIF